MRFAKFLILPTFSLIIVLFSIQAVFSDVSSALAQENQGAIQKALTGMKDTANVAFGEAPKEDVNIYEKLGFYVGIALTFLGIIFLGLTIYGGFVWMTARGNPEDAKKGMQILMDAGIGLIVIVSAYALTVFVGSFFNTK